MICASIGRLIRAVFPGILDQPVMQWEAALVILAVAGALAGRHRGAGLRWISRILGVAAKRPRTAFAGCAIAALLLHALVQPWLPRRAPEVHDEFSYLLAAETFLAGRVTNPPPAFWRNMETAHVLFRPTYTSMYPPAQGLLLAFGKWVANDFLAGPWLAGAATAAAAGWMLAAWVPLRWALAGALIVVLRISVFSYWANSYWGGAIAAIGGLLVMGGLPRFVRKARPGDGALVAGGLLLLAASRPFEGVLCAAAAVLALPASNGKGVAGLRRTIKASIPAILLLVAGLASILYYNARLTGNPLLLGYNLNMQRYGLALFPWQSTIATDPPVAPILTRFYESQHQWFLDYRTLAGFIVSRLIAFGRFWAFYLGPLFTLPFFALPLLLRSRRLRWLFLGGLVYLAGLTLNPWFLPHYLAPALGLLLAAMIQATRIVSGFRIGGRRPFSSAVQALPLICAIIFAARSAAPLAAVRPPANRYIQFWFQTAPGNQARAGMVQYLERQPGRHIVIVSYSPEHDSGEEWVYNSPSPRDARIIWVHDLGLKANAELAAHYRDRRVWLLEVDRVPQRLMERRDAKVAGPGPV